MARPIKVMIASEDVRAELERRAKASTSAHRDRFRSKIILLRLDGLRIEDVAERMNTSMHTVSIWSNRFERLGLDGLKDKMGRGRKPSIPAAKIERVITEATRPPEGRNRWSVPSGSASRSSSPRLIVERASPVIRDTIERPPPAVRTSAAANNLRPRSSSLLPTVFQRYWMPPSSIMQPTYACSPKSGILPGRVTQTHAQRTQFSYCSGCPKTATAGYFPAVTSGHPPSFSGLNALSAGMVTRSL